MIAQVSHIVQMFLSEFVRVQKNLDQNNDNDHAYVEVQDQ